MTDVLANAVWHSLRSSHTAHAEGDGLARRYDPDVSIFHAIDEPSDGAWTDLAPLATNSVVVLFRESPLPEPPAGWKVLFAGEGHQMVRTSRGAASPQLPDEATMRALTADDVVAMSDLVARTEPGPWRPRTIELGGYVGIFHGEALVAMAGQRLWIGCYREISAVCTEPDARGRGLASALVARLVNRILAAGEVPFLHVDVENPLAIALYRRLGFVPRAELPLLAAKRLR